MEPTLRPRTRAVLIAAVFLLILLPRWYALDRFATPDEPRWLTRSANFLRALNGHDLKSTQQSWHPGVPIQWAGAAGILTAYPTFLHDAHHTFQLDGDLEPFLSEHGHRPLELLVAGRRFLVLGIAVTLATAYGFALAPMGVTGATAGFALLALDPFHLGLSRLLHVDGLLASLLVLAVVAALNHFATGCRKAILVSGAAGGLACLQRFPMGLFILPFVALLAAIAGHWRQAVVGRGAAARAALASYGLWMLAAALSFVVFWPAMWGHPLFILKGLWGWSTYLAHEGHGVQIFYGGKVEMGHAGLRIYHESILWHMTPVVLAGVVLAVIAGLARRPPFSHPAARLVGVGLALFIPLDTLYLALGAKQADRYLLPAFAASTLLAGLGWLALAEMLGQTLGRRGGAKLIAGSALLLPVLLQGVSAARQFPYYLDYYSPLMGGGRRAQEVLTVGWGEGLDLAARYLNQKPEAAKLKVLTWYGLGPFSYFFAGQSTTLGFHWLDETAGLVRDADYVILYENQRQRELPSAAFLAPFDHRAPEQVVGAHGIDYAWIYRVDPTLVAEIETAWREHGDEAR